MADYSSAIQIVGLGGTGTNVIEAFIRNRAALMPLLQKEGIRISLLAIDVADHDIISLESAYKNLVEELKSKRISLDKIQLVAKSVKFPTPETMFEFIKNYPDFLERDGIKPPSEYTPWLSSSLEIPPLAGGVGRKRALSKAIYGLNYHHLKLVDNFMDTFKEQVFSSTVQQVVFMIYGLGGGTGSGIALDLARNLRTKLGSSIPIIGLGVLPCSGDDPPAKGASCYSAILEHGAVLDRHANKEMVDNFGPGYQNPFSAFLMMPLGPAYGRTGSVVDAKKLIDDAIVDILMKSLNFDLADLLNNIGSNVDLGGKWVNVISTLKVSYPVSEFIDATKIYLDKLEQLRDLRHEKEEISRGSENTNLGLLHILDTSYEELKIIYKQMQIQRNVYDESTFEKDLNTYVNDGLSLESELIMHLRGGDNTINTQIYEFIEFAESIGVHSPDGSVENRIRNLTLDILNSSKDISKNYQKFMENVIDLCSDLESTLPSAQNLKTRQKQIIRDIIVFGKIIFDYLEGVKSYIKSKALAEKLVKDLSKINTNLPSGIIDRVKKQSAELVANRRFANSLISSVDDELKSVDEMLVDIRVLKKSLIERLDKMKTNKENHVITIKKRENEKSKIESQTKGIRFGFLGSKKKKFKSKLIQLNHELRKIKTEYQLCLDEIAILEKKINSYSNVESKFDVNSSYRKILSNVSELSKEHTEKMTESMRDRGYYDRVAELTRDERKKIMEIVLMEQEDSLTQENIVNEIIDKDHLREYLVGALGIFKIPATLGLTPDYNTDYIWFTVVSPRDLWDKDLESDTKAILSRYSTHDASRSIYIREVDSDDPWTMRFLIIAAKGKPEHLEAFKEMKSLYKQSTPGEQLLSHSLLLEQNKHVTKGNKFVPNNP